MEATLANSTSTSPALAYAYLSAAFDAGSKVRNPLDTLKPLILSVFEDNAGKALNRDEVAAFFATMYGIDLPLNVLSYVMASMVNADRSLLRKEAQGRIDIAHANYVPGDLKRVKESKEIATRAKKLWATAIAHIEKNLVGIEWDFGGPTDVLELFLDESSIGFVGQGGKGFARTNSDKALNQFIYHCIENDADEAFLTALTELAVGDVVYQSIKSVTEYEAAFEEAISRNMKNVKVFFDTRFILNLLGCNGEAYERSAKETLSLCLNTSCQVAVFQHTLEEIDAIFMTVAGKLNMNHPVRDGVAAFALERGMLPSSLLEFAANIPDALSGMGIKAELTSEIIADYSVDEAALHRRIEVDLRQQNIDARTRDISSLTGVYRLRQGKPHRYLEDCEAIFITTNKGLADSATGFFRQHFKDEQLKNSVQICMTDVVFSTRLWIKLPTSARKLPKEQILSHILTNLRPNEALRQTFIDQLTKMSSQGQFSDKKLSIISLSGLTDRMLAIDYDVTQTTLDESQTLGTATKIIAEVGRILRSSAGKSNPEDLKRIEELELELQTASSTSDSTEVREIAAQLTEAKEEMQRLQVKADSSTAKIEKVTTVIAYVGTIALLWPIFSFLLGYTTAEAKLLTLLNLALAILTAYGLSFTGIIKRFAKAILHRIF